MNKDGWTLAVSLENKISHEKTMRYDNEEF